MALFVTTGHKLMGRNNQHMMTILYDGFKEIPDHGCYENLSKALASYGIFPEDIPSPFNLNQHMKIDGGTGKMEHTQIRPRDGNYMDIHAEMDLLVALSACPDLAVGGKPLDVVIYQS